MSDALRIGVVYGDRNPDIMGSFAPEGAHWRTEFFHENSILKTPVEPRRDFLVVFFPAEGAVSQVARNLATIFPGAEIVGYLSSENHGEHPVASGSDGGSLLVVPHPIGPVYARQLVERAAALRSSEAEVSLMRRRTGDLEEIFGAFISMIECACSPDDRKLGVRLLIHKILSKVDAEECVLYLFDERGAKLHRAFSTGNLHEIDLFDHHANSSIIEKVISTGSSYVNNRYSLDLRVPFRGEGISVRSVLAYPIERRGEKIGVIEILNKKSGEFTSDDQRFLESILQPLSVALKTLHLFEQSERLTITDDLTGLFNYRYLAQTLESEVKRCLRYKKKVSLLFIDVDGFKRINDTFGHLVGSHALSEMGQVFRRSVRETDIVGRYGGDEFVIVLPETPLSGAMVIAERIRKRVEDYEFVTQHLSFRLTVSLGVASCPRHTLTAEGLIKKADAAMYRAKELSKNSIKMAV